MGADPWSKTVSSTAVVPPNGSAGRRLCRGETGQLTGPEHVVVSDFNPNDESQYSSLEVAILSRYPLTDAVEFDRGTDGNSRPGYPPERKLERVDMDGIADMGVGRGFLAADVPASGLVVAVTHLKSSSGRSGDPDRDDARKRELVAAAMARHVAERLAADLLDNAPSCCGGRLKAAYGTFSATPSNSPPRGPIQGRRCRRLPATSVS
ncbi:endonuclease/exonuclease/phosphatase family protein [Alienimonas californiensis]|uniref:endonuclease/exonuclease/phosphatase family protein n=1 Tax=Alienimonas californiensis TaxID=2527989 RepID=UPI0011A368AB|nr:hypothetical protein [Alienimonas californiensis]